MVSSACIVTTEEGITSFTAAELLSVFSVLADGDSEGVTIAAASSDDGFIFDIEDTKTGVDNKISASVGKVLALPIKHNRYYSLCCT